MTSPYLAVLKALYDYEPTSEDEVEIKEDQILFLLEKVDDEWWMVKHKTDSPDDESGLSGLVPASYVEEATPTSTVKALYDYEATASVELTIKENDILHVFSEDEEWLLVKREDGLVGYVPGNYVEGLPDESQQVHNEASQIVIPDSPPPTRPVSVYVDPADRVAATADKAKADSIQTWYVSEVDKKGKKKKGTLGIGNGSIFFASESDKTPVQKWQTVDINDKKLEKSKHLYIELGGPSPASLHFNVGSKDVADQIMEKLESSRQIFSAPSPTQSPSPTTSRPISAVHEPANTQKAKKAAASVHFAAAPAVIPDPETPVEDEDENENGEAEQTQAEGEEAIALYDFTADGEDELTVREGEQLFILDKVTSEEWWKCRNIQGDEGVVPASYVEIRPGDNDEEEEESEAAAAAAVARERAEEVAQREAAARAAAEAEAKAKAKALELEEKRRKDERKAKAAAAAAQAEREQREREREQEREREREQEEQARLEQGREREKEREREIEREIERERERTRDEVKKEAAGHTSKTEPSKSGGQRDSGTQLKFPDEDKVRVWRDMSGQWHTQAQFLGIHKGKIRLHKINGVIIEVPPEKMAVDDVRFLENLTGQKLLSQSAPASQPPQKSRSKDEDDIPLGALSQQRRVQETAQNRPPKRSNIDWFEFFLNAGCEIDDCTRYASAFERDKIDEIILPDIKESTLRSLGLREGDIIRVTKAIEQRKAKFAGPSEDDPKKLQLARDEELARALQAPEDSPRATPPNLFTGPGGALKTQPRRGRPQPKGSGPPANVDVNALSNASEQISRTATPLISSPVVASNATGQSSVKTSSTPKPSGFDDDAWTNRPSSTKPNTTPVTTTAPPIPISTPAVAAPTPPPPPPPPPAVQQPVSAPVPSVAPANVPPTAPPLAPTQPVSTPAQDQGQFELLAKISQYRPPSAPLLQTIPVSPPVITPPSINAGLGVGSSPLSLGQHLQNQQTGLYQSPANGPRGPLAPVPSNQGLLNPLIPTNTGFNHFVPTRPSTNPPPSAFAAPPPIQFQSSQSPFNTPAVPTFSPPLQGFGSPSLLPQPTGFPSINSSNVSPFSNGLNVQPTGFGGQYGGSGNSGFNPNGFNGGLQPQPTGFNPALFLPPSAQSIPPAPQPPKDISPASVFAQMKSGTFINSEQAPQPADKYDALRPQPTGWYPQQGTFGGY